MKRYISYKKVKVKMSWIQVIKPKQEKKDFVEEKIKISKKKYTKETPEELLQNKIDENMLDAMDVFELEYGDQVNQILIEMKYWIDYEHFPFFNETRERKGEKKDRYTFWDYMLENTYEGVEVIDKTFKKNENMKRDIEEENEWNLDIINNQKEYEK